MGAMVAMVAMALRWDAVTQHSASYALSSGCVGIIVDLCAGGSAVRHNEVSCRKYSEYLIVLTYIVAISIIKNKSSKLSVDCSFIQNMYF